MFNSFFENSLNIYEVFRKIGKGFHNNYCYSIVFLVTIGVSILNSGCTTGGHAPVDSRSGVANTSSYASKLARRPLYYKVKKGDTLYSIAWQYGLDYKQLAHWNKIKAPYIIFIGDKIRLAADYRDKTQIARNKPSRKKTASTGKKSKKKTVKVSKGKQKKRNTNNKKKKVNSTPRKKNKTSSKKVNKKKTTSKKTNNKKKVTNSNTHNKKVANKSRSRSGLKWKWPLKGKVIQKFSPSKGKKGIDIAAKNGTKVSASEAGKVVYSGHGLTGYGLLLIIKHNNEYLSAYAHNSQLVVKEGEVVKKGQVIAYTGKTATDRVKLHFEIRKNGQPVNPLKYLP